MSSLPRTADRTDADLDIERHLAEVGRALLLAAVERAADQFEYAYVRERSEFDGPAGAATVDWIRKHLGYWEHWHHKTEEWSRADGPLDKDVRRSLKQAERDGHAYVVRRPTRSQAWGVTPEGEDWLAEWSREHGAPDLPESPKHRHWRMNREDAQRNESAVRQAVRDQAAQLAALAEAATLADLADARHFYLFDLEDLLRALTADEPD